MRIATNRIYRAKQNINNIIINNEKEATRKRERKKAFQITKHLACAFVAVRFAILGTFRSWSCVSVCAACVSGWPIDVAFVYKCGV